MAMIRMMVWVGAALLAVVPPVSAQPRAIAPPPVLEAVLDRGDLTPQQNKRRTLSWQDVRSLVKSDKLENDTPALNQGPLSNEAKALVQQSEAALVRGEAFSAIQLLRDAQRLVPDHVKVVRGMGIAYAMSGNRVRSATYLRRAYQHDTRDQLVLMLLCQQAADRGGLSEAVLLCEALGRAGYPLLGDDYLHRALLRLGYETAAADRLASALTHVDKLDLDQDAAGLANPHIRREMRVRFALQDQMRLGLGDLWLSLGQPDRAATQYAKVSAKDAIDPGLVIARQAYLALIDADKARATDLLVTLLTGPGATRRDAALASYLAEQGVPKPQIAGKLESTIGQRGITLPLIAALSQVVTKDRLVALLLEGLDKEAMGPELLAGAVGMIGFDDSAPEDAAPLATLLSQSAGQLKNRPASARADAKRVIAEVDALVALLRSLRKPVLADNPDAYTSLLTAIAYEHAGRQSDALAAYERALSLEPELKGQLELPMAGLLIAVGRASDALDLLGEVQPEGPWERFRLAALATAGVANPAGAQVMIERRLAKLGEEAKASLLRLELIAQAGNPQQACGLLLRMINTSPQDESLYLAGFGLIDKHFMAFTDLHQAANMRRVFVTRLQANLPESVPARVERAYDIYTKPEQTDEALSLVRSALEEQPANTSAWSLMVRIHEQLGDQVAADAAHESLMQVSELGLNRALSRARRAVSRNDMERAGKVLRDVLALEREGVLPGPEMTGDQAASVLQWLDAADPEAKDRDQQALAMVKRFPDNVQLNNALGYQWAVQGKNLLQAKAMIQRALDKGGDNYSVLDSLAWSQYKLGEFEEAEAVQRRAIDLLREQQLKTNEPLRASKAVLYDHMGDIMYKRGQSASAIRHWQIARAQRLDEEDLMFDPELRTLAGRVDKKIDAIREEQVPPVEPVPGPEAHGPDGHPAELGPGEQGAEPG